MTDSFPTHTEVGVIDENTHANITAWLQELNDLICVVVYTLGGEVTLKFATALAASEESYLWVVAQYARITLLADEGTILHSYMDDEDDSAKAWDLEDSTTKALAPLLTSRLSTVQIDPHRLTLVLRFDNNLMLLLEPIAQGVPDDDHYWSAILTEDHTLTVSPGRRYVLEHRDDPLPPPPYRPALRVQESVLAGPDHAGRGPFAYEAHTSDDLTPVQAVLNDLLGQPCAAVKVYENKLDTLRFGQERQRISRLTGKHYSVGDWTLYFDEGSALRLTAPDSTHLWVDVFNYRDNPALAALVGARVTGAQVHLDDLGLTLAFDNGLTLALHPPATPHPPPDPYAYGWRLSGPDRPQRVLDVGPGRLVSYLVWPPSRGQG